MPETILIVDDDVFQLSVKEQTLQHKLHYHTIKANGREAAIEWVISAKKPQPDLMLLDLVSMGDSGLEVLRTIKSVRPDFPMIAFTQYGDTEHAVKAVAAGAHDFLTKPVMLDRLRISLQHAMRMKRMNTYIGWLERKIAGHVDFCDIVGQSPGIRQAIEMAKGAAAATSPVWIEGEEGTGKELFARAIHGGSSRAGKPFVTVNCETLPEHVAESILFGQDSGFQPSQAQFALGKLRAADQGTLMLKEVGALKPDVQRKLTEWIDTGMILPLGATAKIKVDARLICTTTKSVEYHHNSGIMELSLLKHLRRTIISLPPLAERKGDVAALADHFLTIYAASENKYIQRLTDRALQWIVNSPWPGNVAHLSQVIWRAVLLTDSRELDITDLQLVQKSKPIYFAEAPRSLMAAAGSVLLDEKGRTKTLKSVEEEAIRYALQHTGGCMARAARNLGIGRSTLYRKVNELELSGYISRANQTTRPMMDASSGDRS